jgi:phosphoenolpyruvate carboxylase
MPRPTSKQDSAAKDQPLRDDIRLLGRLLGEVIRDQEGREAYELVERKTKPPASKSTSCSKACRPTKRSW